MQHRVFLAINLPNTIKDYLINLADQIKSDNQHLKIKWVEKENLHLTLHFLGYLTTDKIIILRERLDSLTRADIGAVNVGLGELICFPDELHPKIISVSVVDEGRLLFDLYSLLTSYLRSLNIPVDSRSWKPHITLGRINSSGSISLKSVQTDKHVFLSKNCDLMESILSPQGPRYKILNKYDL